MSEIIFQTKGYKVPLTLEVEVDGESVTYNKVDGGIHFTVWLGDTEKALSIVNEIISQIKAEHDDPMHFVTWRTVAIDVLEVSEYPEYVRILWKFYIGDAG